MSWNPLRNILKFYTYGQGPMAQLLTNLRRNWKTFCFFGSPYHVYYNCRGFPKTPNRLGVKPTINSLLNDENCDIICLQETFLSKQDLSCLNVIHKDFQGIGASSTDTRDKLISGHPYGGVAIMYRIKYSKCVTPINFNLDWVIGISIDSGSFKHVVLCVYMKCVSGSHEDHRGNLRN